MKILGIDTETTGLDVKNDEVTEVGLVLFDTEARQPVRITGYLCKVTRPISEEITKITGITQSMIDTYGVPSKAALEGIIRQAQMADFFCAHNGLDFDAPILRSWAAREGLTFPDLPWIDTKTDLPTEAYGKSASMKYMAADHGFLYDAHRAVSDVLAMFKILDKYDANAIIERAKTPNVHVRALVSYDDRNKAKERGYHWKPEIKSWIKPLKETEVAKEKEEAGFEVIVCQ